MSGGQTFKNNKVWHSNLKYASPIVLRFKGAPFKSQHSNDMIVFFEVRGDPHDKYYYVCENEMIVDQIADDIAHGVWLQATFDGMKAEATLEVKPASESSAPSSGGRTVRGAAPEKSYSTGSVVGDWLLCLEQAKIIAKDELGVAPKADVPSASVTKEIATSLYISWKDTRFLKPLVDSMPEPGVDDEVLELKEQINTFLEDLPAKNGKAHDGRALKTTLAKISDAMDENNAEHLTMFRDWLDAEVEFQAMDPEEPEEDDLPF